MENYIEKAQAIADRDATLNEDNGDLAREKYNFIWHIMRCIATQDAYIPDDKVKALTLLIEMGEDYKVFL